MPKNTLFGNITPPWPLRFTLPLLKFSHHVGSESSKASIVSKQKIEEVRIPRGRHSMANVLLRQRIRQKRHVHPFVESKSMTRLLSMR
jgi:hypothetical protein